MGRCKGCWGIRLDGYRANYVGGIFGVNMIYRALCACLGITRRRVVCAEELITRLQHARLPNNAVEERY